MNKFIRYFSLSGALLMYSYLITATSELIIPIVDNEILRSCIPGSIWMDPDGVCINVLKADFISATDVLIMENFNIASLTTAGVMHNDVTGGVSSSLIINTDIDPTAAITDTKLATITTANKVANSATTATNTNTNNAIVARDSSGNFSAGTITASLNGNATTATSTANFSGSLSGDVTGTQGATVISNAVSANTANAIVRRTASGGFSAAAISVTDCIANGNLVLTTTPSSSTAGNIIKGSTRFIHNTGTNNTFIGINSGNFTTTGTGQNVGLGDGVLIVNTTGNSNVALGFNALNSCTTGSSNIAVGTNAGTTLTTGNNNIYIAADAATTSEGNTIRMGTTQTACYVSGIRGVTLLLSGAGVFIDSNGRLGTLLSSRKFKHNIQDMNDYSSNVLKLRPVVFAYNEDETETMQYGLIAEEVNEVFPNIILRDKENEIETVQYHILPILLLNEIQKQQSTISDLSRTVSTMGAAILSLEKKIAKFIK